jgi:hypothetical protein
MGTGVVSGNVLLSCDGVPALNANQPGSEDGFVFTGNVVHGVDGGYVVVIDTPVVSVVGGGDAKSGKGLVLQATCATPGAELFYTTDGSVPTEAGSAIAWPGGSGGRLQLPARTMAVFVKAFANFAMQAAAAKGEVRVVPSPAEGGVYSPANPVGRPQ